MPTEGSCPHTRRSTTRLLPAPTTPIRFGLLSTANPVDGVWGARWYFLNTAALDVAYRYMLNLHQLNDRSGFTIKVSKVLGWKR